LVLAELRLEVDRREQIGRAIAGAFEVRARQFVVRRAAVHEAVRAALDLPTVAPWLRQLVTQVARDMGAVPTKVANRRLFRCMCRRGLSEAMALAESLRHLHQRPHAPTVRMVRTVRVPLAASVDYEALLVREAMPAELAPCRIVDEVRAQIAQAADLRARIAEEILRLWRQGRSIRGIARELDVDKARVHRMLLALGVSKTSGRR
jgi:hypothetical protein